MAKPIKTDFGAPPTMANVARNAPLSVSDLAQQIKRAIETQFGFVQVRGEIGSVSRPASGHIYLNLKDDKAVLSAVIWRGVAAQLAHQPEEGLEVICTGKLTTYGQNSRYQLIIDDLAPAGKGALMAMIEARRKKFAAEGLFDGARKKPLPFLPARIGLITSPSGAVLRDILHRVKERFGREVLLWSVQVQGAKCAREVADAIDGFNRLPAAQAPDLLIVARGGGSFEDLQGFSDEALVLAASRSAIPIISAIGHETDHTLLDLVADKRAPTPTAAAEFAVPVRAGLMKQLEDLSTRKTNALELVVKGGAGRVADGFARLRRLAPEFIQRLEQRMDNLTAHLPHALRGRMREANEKLNGLKLTAPLKATLTGKIKELAGVNLAPPLKAILAGKAKDLQQVALLLNAVSYQKVLERGFTLLLDGKGNLVTGADKTKVGQHLKIEFSHNKQIEVERIDPQTKQGKLFDA